MINKKKVYERVDDAVNNVFFECQTEVGASGDICPLDALELDRLQEELTDLICRVVDKAAPEKEEEK